MLGEKKDHSRPEAFTQTNSKVRKRILRFAKKKQELAKSEKASQLNENLQREGKSLIRVLVEIGPQQFSFPCTIVAELIFSF